MVKISEKKWIYPRKGPGGPRVAQKITDLVSVMAREHISWGYDRIQGALANLGHNKGICYICLEGKVEKAIKRILIRR